jgi:hypothetical protein
MGENRENEIGIGICVDLGWKTKGNEIEMGISVDLWRSASFSVLGKNCATVLMGIGPAPRLYRGWSIQEVILALKRP